MGSQKKVFNLLILSVLIMFGYGMFKIYQSKPFKKYIPKITTISGDKPYEELRIKKYELHGLDISIHQGDIEWEKVKHPKENLKINFVFIRSNYGIIKDKKFDKNWEQALKNNFVIGAYHYYRPNLNSTFQAKAFIRTVKLTSGNLPPVLDVEISPTSQSRVNWMIGIKNWISLVESHYGVLPIIYTYDAFYRHKLMDDPYFKNYPRLWIANYNKVSQPKSNWHFWQVSDKVHIPGINEKVDYNVFNGSLVAFNKLLIP